MREKRPALLRCSSSPFSLSRALDSCGLIADRVSFQYCRPADLRCPLPMYGSGAAIITGRGVECSRCPVGQRWPTRRQGAAVAWDAGTHKMFMFGGSRRQAFKPMAVGGTKMTLADLWVFEEGSGAWCSTAFARVCSHFLRG